MSHWSYSFLYMCVCSYWHSSLTRALHNGCQMLIFEISTERIASLFKVSDIMIYPVSRNVKSHSSAFDYAWLLVYYIQAQLTLPYLPCLPINVFAQWKPVCLKIETNIANVSVVNLVKYISDKLKARFLFKMQPKFTADEKVKQSRIWWKIIDYHKDLLGSMLPRATAVRGQDLEIQEGKRKLFLLCSLSGTVWLN